MHGVVGCGRLLLSMSGGPTVMCNDGEQYWLKQLQLAKLYKVQFKGQYFMYIKWDYW